MGGTAAVLKCQALPLDVGMPELLLLTHVSLRQGRNPVPSLDYPVPKACRDPQLPPCTTRVLPSLHQQGLSRATYREGMHPTKPDLPPSSQNALPLQSLPVCTRIGMWMAPPQTMGQCRTAFPWEFCTFFGLPGNGVSKGLKPPGPQQQLWEEEHWNSKRTFRGTDSHKLPLTHSKEDKQRPPATVDTGRHLLRVRLKPAQMTTSPSSCVFKSSTYGVEGVVLCAGTERACPTHMRAPSTPLCPAP